ncbi:hypothetical protein [Pseudomonas aeruginosa]|uniref:hypothetical protein n=1 Tax=Pseudomonas aeruginosa TaxID=287 RepID=UPI000ABDA82D|nr:hypothetical protein [Pseudomonas aeruginosa]
MNKANECTCPSGDGSLVHPCPAHPAVEQVGGDERAAFELFVRKHCGMPAHIAVNWDAKFTNDAWAGWQARAALAQPSPAGEYGDAYQGAREDIAIWKRRALEAEQALRQAHNGQTFMGEPLVQPYEAPREKVNALFKVLGFSGTASVGDILDAALERLQAQPSPAQAEQAEAERPEVVAYRTIGRHTKHQHPHYALNYYKQNAEDQAAHWRERGCEVSEDELMTVAQHERIVGELRAKLQAAEDRADTLEHRMMGMMTRHFAEAWRNRDTQKALDGYLSAGIAQLEQERDAALAEVERLRQLERICEGLPQDAIDGGWTVQGIRCYAKRLEDQLKSALARVAELTANRNRYGVDAHYFNKNLQRILRDFESFTPDELARSLIILAKVADEKVVAQHSVPEGFIGRLSEFLAQRGATGKALLRELRDMLAAAPAMGQHSVPEEFSFEYRHPNGECHTVTVSREQVINEMPDFLFEALCSKFCNCEPVGETNVVECRCDEYAEEFKLLAAAPGKEGL